MGVRWGAGGYNNEISYGMVEPGGFFLGGGGKKYLKKLLHDGFGVYGTGGGGGLGSYMYFHGRLKVIVVGWGGIKRLYYKMLSITSVIPVCGV